MNGHFFPLFISISENESLRNLTNHFLVKKLIFCKRSMRLPSVNLPCDSSFHMLSHVILQQPLETKSKRLRDLLKITQLKSSWVSDTQSHVLPIISCWLLSRLRLYMCQVKISTWQVQLSILLCPILFALWGEWGRRRDFCVSSLSLILITRELFCKTNSIFP